MKQCTTLSCNESQVKLVANLARGWEAEKLYKGGGFLRETARTEDGPDIKIQMAFTFHPRTHAKEIKAKDCFPLALSSVTRQIFFLNKRKDPSRENNEVNSKQNKSKGEQAVFTWEGYNFLLVLV